MSERIKLQKLYVEQSNENEQLKKDIEDLKNKLATKERDFNLLNGMHSDLENAYLKLESKIITLKAFVNDIKL